MDAASGRRRPVVHRRGGRGRSRARSGPGRHHRLADRSQDFAGSAAGGLKFLAAAYRDLWREPGAMAHERWAEPSGPAFYGYAGHPVIDVVLHVLDEFTHHAAVLGVLRDLYPYRPVE